MFTFRKSTLNGIPFDGDKPIDPRIRAFFEKRGAIITQANGIVTIDGGFHFSKKDVEQELPWLKSENKPSDAHIQQPPPKSIHTNNRISELKDPEKDSHDSNAVMPVNSMESDMPKLITANNPIILDNTSFYPAFYLFIMIISLMLFKARRYKYTEPEIQVKLPEHVAPQFNKTQRNTTLLFKKIDPNVNSTTNTKKNDNEREFSGLKKGFLL